MRRTWKSAKEECQSQNELTACRKLVSIRKRFVALHRVLPFPTGGFLTEYKKFIIHVTRMIIPVKRLSLRLPGQIPGGNISNPSSRLEILDLYYEQ